MNSTSVPATSEGSSAVNTLPSGRIETSLNCEEPSLMIPSHPLFVRPSGNSYIAKSNAQDRIGELQILPAEVLIILLEYFDSLILTSLGATCKYLYAFCRLDDLWRKLFIESSRSQSGSFRWRGTWRSTYQNFDSRPFLCTQTPVAPYTTNIPARNTIPRLQDLSVTGFSNDWSNRPFILTNEMEKWSVYQDWSIDTLCEKYENVKFRAEAVDWSMKTYFDYMRNNQDECPLYLFDRDFCGKMNLTVGKHHEAESYWIPECFGEDLFTVLEDQRPDNKWLIIGPARSGSTYHKDPNQTSAWNAVIRGSKYWIMFPSNTNPPGVYVSEDQSEVTSPLSIAEWLLGFHKEARETTGCLEGLCNAGEILHVPACYWHLVVNLDESIAITHNFLPKSHLPGVISFLKHKSDQVSGFKKDVTDPYCLFTQRMKQKHPELLQEALEKLEKASTGSKHKWGETTVAEGDVGFSFGFGGNDDEEVP